MPQMQDALGNRRVGRRSVEIRALPALLSSGTDHLERAVLSSSAKYGDYASAGRDAVSMRGLPLQLRKLPPVQRALFMAEGSGGGAYHRSKAVTGKISGLNFSHKTKWPQCKE